ncbi:MAG: epoxyqueuosine reductase QueH [Syntrophales bacterium]|nr:epoxyqueuosine reductase QueH [Syntrophales bacterium]
MHSEKTILLHVCCGPCTIYPLKKLSSEGYEVIGFFFNPNIHPYSEYIRRRDALLAFAYQKGLKVIQEDRYLPELYFRGVAFREDTRCFFCYEMRLRETAQKAKEMGIDSFSTTMLYSRYQKHGKIKELGEKIAQDVKLSFVYRDFRVGWKEGIEESRSKGMYRQHYCGCIYSERERYKF